MQPEYFVNADVALLKAYDYSVVKEAFDYIVNESGIEFRYPQGGCQQRAHTLSIILKQKFNIDHFKIWLFSPAALMPGDCRTLFINDANKFTKNNTIEWNYHVVPMIKVNNEKSIWQMVIDPSLNAANLLSLPDFFNRIGNANISKYTFLLPDKYFFNTSTVNNEPTYLFDGSFSNYDDAVKNDLTVEKGLALNDTVMEIYHTYVENFSASNEAESRKLEDLKAIFGNATAADLLFSQNISGNTENTTLRYAFLNYPQIMQEAKNIFYARLTYWAAFTSLK